MNMEELVDNFSALDGWEDRYKYLIDLGARLPAMDSALKTPETRVPGCLSQVWMVALLDAGGRIDLVADSDAQIVRGLIAVLRAMFVGLTPAEARAVDVEGDFARLGLAAHLSPNRRNGFFSMVERVRGFISRCT